MTKFGVHQPLLPHPLTPFTLAPLSGRGAIADYMSVVVGGDNQSKKVFLTGALHPAIERAVEITAGYFDELMIRNQDFLSTPEKRNQVSIGVVWEAVIVRLETRLAQSFS